MNSSFRRAALFIIPLTWVLVVIAIYFVYHKPFTPDIAFRLSRAIWQSFSVFLILAISGAIGIRIIGEKDQSTLIVTLLQTSLGFGVISILALIIGAIIGFNQIGILGGLAFLGLILHREVLKWIKAWGGISSWWRQAGGLARVIIAGSVAILTLSWISALAPPLKFDALVYHLVFPQTYLSRGRFIFLSDNIYWGMPQNGELLYTLAAAMGGIEAATLLGWTFALLAIIAIVDFVSHHFGEAVAWISVASLLGGYTLAASPGWGYVDWLAFLFGLAFMISLIEWYARGENKWLVYSGVFAGFAWGTKYTAGILLVAGIFIIAWKNLFTPTSFGEKRIAPSRAANLIRTFFSVSLFIAVATFVFSPWFIKNLIAVGSPLYPLLFPAGMMDQFRIDLYQSSSHWGNWLDLILLPVRATILGREGGEGYSASIGPLLLGLAPFAWIGLKKRNYDQIQIIHVATWIAFSGLLIWAIAGRISGMLIQTRLYYAIFSPIAILAGIGFDNLRQMNWQSIRMSRLVGTLVLLVLGFTLLQSIQVSLTQDGLSQLSGVRSSDEYLDKNLGWYMPAMRTINELPVGARVLMLWEPRSLYCLPKCDPDEILDRWLHDLRGKTPVSSTQTILEEWRDAGYTHLLFFQAGADFIRQNDSRYLNSDWTALNELLSGLETPENFGDMYYLYSISS